MTMHSPSLLAAPTRALAMLLCWLVLAGCALSSGSYARDGGPRIAGVPSLVSVLREDPRQPGSYTRDGGTRIAGALSIIRNGRTLDANLPAMLQPGDVLQTGPDAAAVIRYPNGTEVILDTNTRVRFGSLFVEFGRILARVRGLFEVDTENVVTGVEGTEYVLQVARDGSVKVVVFDGAVVCRSKTARWNPVRLRRGETFLYDFPNHAAPLTRPATRNELEDARSWIYGGSGGSREPVPSGYCCEDAGVRRSTPDQCRGVFSLSEKEAVVRCEQAQEGYCCSDGTVSRATRSRCAGRFFLDRNAAYEECRPPVETGYCCGRGKVFKANRKECERVKGGFHDDRSRAESACTPSAEKGYCCERGKSYATTRDRCARVKGSFFDDRKAAERACTPTVEKGYCCDDGKTYSFTRDRCERAKGRFYEDRKEAERACRPVPPKPELKSMEQFKPYVPSTPTAPTIK